MVLKVTVAQTPIPVVLTWNASTARAVRNGAIVDGRPPTAPNAANPIVGLRR